MTELCDEAIQNRQYNAMFERTKLLFGADVMKKLKRKRPFLTVLLTEKLKLRLSSLGIINWMWCGS